MSLRNSFGTEIWRRGLRGSPNDVVPPPGREHYVMNLGHNFGTDIWHRGLQSSPNDSVPPPGREDYVIVVLVIMIFALICLVFLNPARRCGWCVDPQNTPEARDRRFRDSMRPTSLASTPHMSEQDRREFISNLLVTKRVILTTGDGGSAGPTVHKFHNMILPYCSSSLHSSASRDGVDICSICLNEYEDGDEICWSHNKNCDHVFHRQCITEWLIRHDECPICRQNFLSLDDLDEERAEDTERQEQAPERRDVIHDEDSATAVSRPFRSMFYGMYLVSSQQNAVHPMQQSHLELAGIDTTRVVANAPEPDANPSSSGQHDDDETDSGSRTTEETNVEPENDDGRVAPRPTAADLSA